MGNSMVQTPNLDDLTQDPDEMHNQAQHDPMRVTLLEALSQAMMMADDSSRGAPSSE